MPCIFCLTAEPLGSLTDEHIIPRFIGGGLILKQYVCEPHNSWLGAHVDSELLKMPEVYDALKAVGK